MSAWCFTINNYTPAIIEGLKALYTCQGGYLIWGCEVAPTTGTPHLQCYYRAEKRKTDQWFRNQLNSCCNCQPHVEKAKGTAKENIDYCSKDGQWEERGTRPAGQGKRKDLDELGADVLAGASYKDIAMDNPGQFIRYHRGIKELISTTRFGHRSSEKAPLCLWIYGRAGKGKSRAIHDTGLPVYTKMANNKWWDCYQQETIVLIDDYRPCPELPLSYLLLLTDRYPMLVEQKGHSMPFNSPVIVITAPMHPSNCFQDEHMDQLERRMQYIEIEQSSIEAIQLIIKNYLA